MCSAIGSDLCHWKLSLPRASAGHRLDVGSNDTIQRSRQFVTTLPPALHACETQIGGSGKFGRIEGLVGNGIPPDVEVVQPAAAPVVVRENCIYLCPYIRNSQPAEVATNRCLIGVSG